jgi:DNA helicase II / ATP-dependent DNA helicase PcrA
MWVSTFHSACARILRREAAHLGMRSSFSIYDQADAVRLTGYILRDFNLDPKRLPPRQVHAAISAAKNELVSPTELLERALTPYDRKLAEVYAEYQKRLTDASALDFDDLLTQAVNLFRRHPDVASQWRSRFAHVLVDEFQDLNPAQYRLAALLASGHGRLTVLGDPRQAICAYRGATSAENFAAFAADFPEAATVELGRNYRSTAPILAAANRLAAPLADPGAALRTVREGGAQVRVVRCDDGDQELECLVAWARANPRASRAVLVRVNDQTAPIEQALLAAGVRARVFGATPFTARAEIRDALAALAVVVNPRDRLAFGRVAAAAGRGVGPAACRTLFAHADRHPQRTLLELAAAGDVDGLSARQAAALVDLCDPLLAAARGLDAEPAAVRRHVIAVLVASGQPARLRRTAGGGARPPTRWRAERQLRNLRALVAHARAYEQRTARPRLGDFLADLALAGEQRATGEDAVVLTTIHRAKGLEFDHVWIAGAEEGRLPHSRSVGEGQEDEERRLAYVAVTRAKRTLHASWAERRAGRQRAPSRYLAAVTVQEPGASTSASCATTITPRANHFGSERIT